VDVASYTGPANLVSPSGEIEVTVDLRSRNASDGSVSWAGHIDRGDPRVSRAAQSVSQYGLIIRLPDGREAHLFPNAECTWSGGSIGVTGFLRE
jgi:hypothetical protein